LDGYVSFSLAYAFNGFWSGCRTGKMVRNVVMVSFEIDTQKNCSLLEGNDNEDDKDNSQPQR